MKNKYARDKSYPPPLKWGSLYGKYFPVHTDSRSRHVKVISQSLRDLRSPLRKHLVDLGYEPDHLASSMEETVKMLWDLRARVNKK